MQTAKELALEYHCRYCGGDGYKCLRDLEMATKDMQLWLDLLAVSEEIANDSKVDLVFSERRLKLYAAIKAIKGDI